MKPYIPAELYAAKMCGAFASLPDFYTYDVDVCDAVAPTASNVVAPTAFNGCTTSKRVNNYYLCSNPLVPVIFF